MAGRTRTRWSRGAAIATAATAAVLALPGIANAAVTASVQGTELYITSTADDAIAVTCVTNQVWVNGAAPQSGSAACDTLTSIQVTGGPGANAIDLSAVTTAAFPAITRVAVDGAGGADTITGSEHADALAGGPDNDRILGEDNPPATRDVFEGQAGDDTLVWNPGDDDDRMEGGDGADTIEVNGGGGGEVFEAKPSATLGRVQFDRTGPTPPGPFNLDIGTAERLDLNTAGGDDSFTAADGLVALGFALDIDGGEGNDTLDGGDGADLIVGGNGNDRIVADDNPAGTRDDAQGQGGDDTLVWNPGDDDDRNEGGDGADIVEVNGGTGGEVFAVKPSATAGRVQFDRTGPTPPGPFSIDIGTAERLLLNAGGGDDRISAAPGLAPLIASTFNGQDGNDRIGGTDGVDLLSGGAGNDVIRARDAAADQVECDADVDFARVDSLDLVRGCELVLGGALRVRVADRTLETARGAAAIALRCVGTERCRGTVQLLRNGRPLGKARFAMRRGVRRTVAVRLNRRGRRMLAQAPRRGTRIRVRIDARDARGNGWRTVTAARLHR